LQYKLALALYRSGDAAAAADAARRAVALDPNFAEARQLLGMAALAQGRADEASAELNRALKLQPALDATRWTLVDLYAMQGRTRDEATQREALAALDASRPEGLVSLALAQARHGRS